MVRYLFWRLFSLGSLSHFLPSESLLLLSFQWGLQRAGSWQHCLFSEVCGDLSSLLKPIEYKETFISGVLSLWVVAPLGLISDILYSRYLHYDL